MPLAVRIAAVLVAVALCCPAALAAEVLVYTALEDDELVQYREAFQKAHPEIELNIVRDSTGIMTAKLLAERNNPRADVVWGLALTSLLVADSKGMLAPYTPEGIERIDPKFRDTKNDEPHWVGMKAWMSGFVGNTIEMERFGLTPPQSFADLVKPEYEGRIAMPNPASSGTGFLTVSAILQLKGEEEGWAYLDKLHENIALYTHSGSAPAKLAGAGEFPLGISFGYRGIKQKAAGQPVVTTFPEEGCGWELEAVALIRKPRMKEAAKRVIDWAVSPEAMQLYAQYYPITAAETGLPAPEGYPARPKEQLVDNDFYWAAENRDRILDEWTRRYEAKSE